VQFLYALLWNVGGGTPWLFHAYAVVLHAACAVAVLSLLARALPARAAFAGALLFAVHPVHVEGVASIVGSADVLATLAGVACVGVAVRALAGQRGDVNWLGALGAAALYAIALGAKETAVVVPGLAALAAWGWRRARDGAAPSFEDVLRRGRRMWIACAVVLVVLLFARRLVLGTFGPPESALAVGIRDAGFFQRWWTMTAAWPLVGRLLFWPRRLAAFYGDTTVVPHHTITRAAALSILVVLGSLALAAWIARRGDRRPLVALLWIGLGYLAASNILLPSGQLLAERTMVLSSAGAAMLVAWLIGRADESIDGLGAALTVAAFGVAAAGLVRTTARTRVWANGEELFVSAIHADPLAFQPYPQLARWYGRRGDDVRGMAFLAKAYSLRPEEESLALEYGQHLHASERDEEALAVARAASIVHPTSQPARLFFLDMLLQRRGADSVIREIERRRTPDPAGTLRYVVLARAYERRWGPDSVPGVYARAVAAQPSDAAMRFQYAVSLHAARRDREARAQLTQLDARSGIPVSVLAGLRASVELALGDTAAARGTLAAARAAAPGDTTLERLEQRLARPAP
jgi:Tfp pilus assembly protein PilF